MAATTTRACITRHLTPPTSALPRLRTDVRTCSWHRAVAWVRGCRCGGGQLLTRIVDRVHQWPDGYHQPAAAGPQRGAVRRPLAAQHFEGDPRTSCPVRL